jgi:hypothetical protein
MASQLDLALDNLERVLIEGDEQAFPDNPAPFKNAHYVLA